jgi:RimJ/RimL family protein N-acetyltransferase
VITFRQLAIGDAEKMLAWVSSREIQHNLGLTNEPDLEKTLQWIARLSESKTIHAMAIELDSVHVGNVVLDQIDPKCRFARLSIYIGDSSARGRGVGSHSVRHALQVAFQNLKLNKVWLTVHCGNIQAIKTYAKCGFSVEGIRRQEFVFANRLVDCFHMGILASEFA